VEKRGAFHLSTTRQNATQPHHHASLHRPFPPKPRINTIHLHTLPGFPHPLPLPPPLTTRFSCAAVPPFHRPPKCHPATPPKLIPPTVSSQTKNKHDPFVHPPRVPPSTSNSCRPPPLASPARRFHLSVAPPNATQPHHQNPSSRPFPPKPTINTIHLCVPTRFLHPQPPSEPQIKGGGGGGGPRVGGHFFFMGGRAPPRKSEVEFQNPESGSQKPEAN
jgi:hypothetical protein